MIRKLPPSLHADHMAARSSVMADLEFGFHEA